MWLSQLTAGISHLLLTHSGMTKKIVSVLREGRSLVKDFAGTGKSGLSATDSPGEPSCSVVSASQLENGDNTPTFLSAFICQIY